MQRPASSSNQNSLAPKKKIAKIGRKQAPFAERALHVATVALAVGATAFAAEMISASDRIPTFAGAEHLMIFARPSTVAARRNQENPALVVANKNGIDYSPVGGVGKNPAPVRNGPIDYKLIEADQNWALIRDPRGSIMRVSKGEFVTGLGKIEDIVRKNDRWTVVTPRGVIAENSASGSKEN
ncbi:hypothetical protein [Methylocystis iwaonis]|uniref:Uncharacterized protein n=1 Tax=Methylocystis iwaonis TaxID=2885079 RepID=A0ABM8E4T5_9HYPH|nr:hypothetical protein [Methylocystis iwaonis]BDV32983.1 hypothetical protein SS37A_05120 [Methylocystis iwaonis]